MHYLKHYLKTVAILSFVSLCSLLLFTGLMFIGPIFLFAVFAAMVLVAHKVDQKRIGRLKQKYNIKG